MTARAKGIWRAGGENVYVFDVRTAEEYAAGHLPGATWAPGGQAVQAIDEYVAVRGAQIVFVCDDAPGRDDRRVVRPAGIPQIAYFGAGCRRGPPAGAPSRGAGPRDLGARDRAGQRAAVAPGAPGDALVLSVDPSDVYVRAHVPGAAWLCRSRLEPKIGPVAPDLGPWW